MRKILFLTQILPYPLDAGPKLRAYYLLRYLAQHYQVTLLAFTRLTDTPQAIAHLHNFCEEVFTVPLPRSKLRNGFYLARSLVSGQSFIILRDWQPAMQAQLHKLIPAQTFDAIHADQLWMAHYALTAYQFAQEKGGNPKLVLDQHNAVHLIPQRMANKARNPFFKWLLKREARLMKCYETSICQKFDHVIWVTKEDQYSVQMQQQLSKSKESCSHNRNSVIPICINPESIEPVKPLTQDPVILFLGGMHWPPNSEGITWFVQKVLPLIQRKLPNVRLIVVGKSPPTEIQEKECITTPGFVEDVEPFWRQSRVFVVPLRAGGGMRVKILDAWAHGLPVVSTSIGAEGLDYRVGEDILIADEANDFANTLLQVLCQDNIAQQLSQAGLEIVRQRYDWQIIYKAWDEVYEQA